MRVRPSTEDDQVCRAAHLAPIVDAWQRRTSWAAAARTRRCTTWNDAGWWCSPGTGDVATVSWTSWPWTATGRLYRRTGEDTAPGTSCRDLLPDLRRPRGSGAGRPAPRGGLPGPRGARGLGRRWRVRRQRHLGIDPVPEAPSPVRGHDRL